MLNWWEKRYEHLKVYSVYPWTGEQCTTTVKTAIQQAFPFGVIAILGVKNWITDTTQMPSGLLEDLKSFKGTSKQHSAQYTFKLYSTDNIMDYTHHIHKDRFTTTNWQWKLLRRNIRS